MPQVVYQGRVVATGPDIEGGWKEYPDTGLTLFKHLNDHEFAIGYFNFAPAGGEIPLIFADAGLPSVSGFGLHLTDVISGEDLGVHRDYYNLHLASHESRILKGRLVQL